MYRYKIDQKLLLVCVILLSILFFSCKQLHEAEGPDDRIYVIADSLTYNKVKEALEYTFTKTIFTPQPEKSFELIRKNITELDETKKYRNIIVIAPYNSGSVESKLISQILNKKMKELAESGKEFVFIKNNQWQKNQLVMVLTQKDLALLNKNIIIHNETLIKCFYKEAGKRLITSLSSAGYEKKDVEEKLYKDYGWKIFIPKNFDLALNIPNENFVWLRSNIAEDYAKWIFIHWIDNASPKLITPDSVISLRNRITEKYFRTGNKKAYITINQKYKKTDEANFNGHYALASQGLWEMSDKSKGGPFINYTFYDERTKRIYILDGSIYAPKYYKKELIQQLDVLLQSFNSK